MQLQVILRLLELAKALDACSSSAAVWSEKLGLLVIAAWEKAAAPPGAGAGEGAAGAGAADLERFLEQRLSLRPAAAEERPGPGAAGKGGQGDQKGKGKGKGKGKDEDGRGGAETTVLVAAKIVGALLGSSSVRVARALATAIARLPADTLRQVALSGQQVSEPDLAPPSLLPLSNALFRAKPSWTRSSASRTARVRSSAWSPRPCCPSGWRWPCIGKYAWLGLLQVISDICFISCVA